jgi:thiol-disulfide isomerase/thioredoxin
MFKNALLLVTVFTVASCASTPDTGTKAGGGSTTHKKSPSVGKAMAVQVSDLSGRNVNIAGPGKVRIIDFWATWCTPCKDSMPYFNRLQQEYGPRGLTVYAISFDEDRKLIPEFQKQVPMNFPVLWDKGGERVAAKYAVARLPTTFIVDKRGVIRFVHEGFDPAIAKAERQQIEKLLAE